MPLEWLIGGARAGGKLSPARLQKQKTSLSDSHATGNPKKTEDNLHMLGVQTSSTYVSNPYMVCTFTAACVDMDASELDRLGNGFTTKNEFKKTYISVLSMILVNVVYQFVSIILRAKAVRLPVFMTAGWPQLTLASITVLGSAAVMAYSLPGTLQTGWLTGSGTRSMILVLRISTCLFLEDLKATCCTGS